MRLWLGLVLFLAAAFAEDPAAGKFLVASRKLADPNFAESVILLIHYDAKSAMGLVINDQATVTLGEVLEETKGAKGRKDPVYLGGPVSRDGVQILIRSKAEPEGAQLVFSDIYITTSRKLLEKVLADADSKFHAYLGYAGWGPGQLDYEIEQGAWHILRGDAATVFEADPESVWPRLIRRTELQVASIR